MLIEALPPNARLIADKGYDPNHFRSRLAKRSTEAVIPSTASRKAPIPFDRIAYRERNLIERMFGRLKDFRRIATRYDKLARNFLAAVALAAIIIWCADKVLSLGLTNHIPWPQHLPVRLNLLFSCSQSSPLARRSSPACAEVG